MGRKPEKTMAVEVAVDEKEKEEEGRGIRGVWCSQKELDEQSPCDSSSSFSFCLFSLSSLSLPTQRSGPSGLVFASNYDFAPPFSFCRPPTSSIARFLTTFFFLSPFQISSTCNYAISFFNF